MSARLLDSLRDCGCTVINTGTLFSQDRNYLFMLRNSATYDFLRFRTHLFDRVILFDLFDTIFQGDPFTREINETMIGFSLETALIRGNHLRGAIILVGKEMSMEKLFWRPVINCGTVIGSMHAVMIFLKMEFDMVKNLSRKDYVTLIETAYPDQALVNVLVRGGFVEAQGLNVRLYEHFELFVSLYKVFKWEYNMTFGHYAPKGVYGLLIHLYDRSPEFCASVAAACPQEFEVPNQYVRCKEAATYSTRAGQSN
jgi:hypothetical protein